MCWTTGQAIRETVLDNYLMFERDAEVVYDFHYRYDLAASNTDRMISKIQLLCVDLDLIVDNEIDELETGDEVEIGCCCIAKLMQQMLVLHSKIIKN